MYACSCVGLSLAGERATRAAGAPAGGTGSAAGALSGFTATRAPAVSSPSRAAAPASAALVKPSSDEREVRITVANGQCIQVRASLSVECAQCLS